MEIEPKSIHEIMPSSGYTRYRFFCIKSFSSTFPIHAMETRLIQRWLGSIKNKLESNLHLGLPHICISRVAIAKSIA